MYFSLKSTMAYSVSNQTSIMEEGQFDRANEAINMYFPPILIVTGTICNFLVIKVMLSMYFRFLSTSFYMGINAGVDNFSLLILLTSHWINANFPSLMYRGHDAHYMCKIFNFLGWTSSDLGILLTTAMTLERSLAIMLPLKVNNWCTVKRAKIITVVSFFVAMAKDIHFLFTSGVVDRTHKYVLCDIQSENKKMLYYWNVVWPWIHNSFLCLMFLVIIVSNIIIIRHVRISVEMQKSANVRHSSSSSSSRQLSSHPEMTSDAKARGPMTARSRKRQILIMLLTDSITIVICTVPFSIYTSISFPQKSLHDRSLHDFIYSLSFYLLYINRCANFYLYCLSGSRFRLALRCVCTSPGNKMRKRGPPRSAGAFLSKDSINDSLVLCNRAENSFCELGGKENIRICTMCDTEIN